jgi:hypothetical protein
LVLVPAVVIAQQKNKKHSDLSTAFLNAHTVYVGAIDGGDVTQPGLYPPDMQAISDVDDGIQTWKRYTLASRKDQADLVFLVRKGRTVGSQVHGGIPSGQRPIPIGAGNPGPQPGQPQSDGDLAPMGSEVGPSDDVLKVFLLDSDGKLVGPIWNREMKDGLDGPGVPLLQMLRDVVEQAARKQQAAQRP